MKSLLIAIVISLLASTSFAAKLDTTVKKTCNKLNGLTHTIVDAKDRGITRSAILDVVGTPETIKLAKFIYSTDLDEDAANLLAQTIEAVCNTMRIE